MVNDIFNYGIFISKQIKKRCNNTHFIFFREFIQNILKCIFIILIVLTIWLEYQNLEYLLCFHHQLAVAKGHTPLILAYFLDQGNNMLMLQQLINQTSQSHHCLIFDVMEQSKGSAGTLHNISCSSIEVHCEKLSVDHLHQIQVLQ